MKLDPVPSFVVATCMASIAATTTVWLLGRSTEQALRCDCQCPGEAAMVPIPIPLGVGSSQPDANARVPVPPARDPGHDSPQAEVHGELPRDLIRGVVRDHIDEIRYCYNEGLVRDPSLDGRVDIQFSIDAAGSVAAAAVATSTLDDDLVEQCMTRAVMRWTFPRPDGGDEVVVTYPFVLEPG